ncbi:MAG: amidohydrolase family protein [Planctomycetia bacterium]|nr:amidohydrolase family protein [Planctomycetia bacterium]
MNIRAEESASEEPRFTRRDALRAVGAGALGLAAAGLGTDAAAQPPKPSATGTAAKATTTTSGAKPLDGFIDAHVHVWTPDVKKYPLAPGFKPADMKPASFTPAELLAHAKPCGVNRITLIQMSFYKYDNSYMLDCMREHPGVFSGVAVIDREQPDVAAKMRELAKQGVRGFRLAPGDAPPESYFNSPSMDAMWRAGADDDLKMCLLINPNALPTVDKLCEKFPETPVVIDHFARIGATGTIADSELAQLCRLARHKHTYVKVSAFYALGKKMPPYLDLGPMIRLLCETFGPQRLMWASDCPFQITTEHNYRDSVDLVLKRLDFLSADDRKHLLTKTAEKVYFS